MTGSDATQLLRAGLLEGAVVLVAGSKVAHAPDGAKEHDVADALAAAYEELGASVRRFGLLGYDDTARGEDALGDEVDRAVGELGGLDVLAVDASSLHLRAASSAGAREGMAMALEASWQITRAVASAAWIAGERPGRVVYLAPPCDGATHTEAITAGLENLARTLSIEWARLGITTVAVALAQDMRAGEVAALCAYLASPAGAYFSGCLLDLRGVTPG